MSVALLSQRLPRGTADRADASEMPFFAAAVAGGDVHLGGDANAFLGHRLPGGGGRVDEGIFAEWSWDGETLTVTNDRYGMVPLFFGVDRDRIWLSPSIPRLLEEGAPAELDFDALSVFLRIGFFLREDTPFARIKALPPNARLEWRRGTLRIEGAPFLTRSTALSRAAALDGYIDSFRGAIRRREAEADEVAVPLSAGRDSRHIVLELHEQGRRPKLCVTTKHYPPRRNDDAEIAARLSAVLGIGHAILEQSERFDTERRKNVLTSFCSDEHAWAPVLADHLRGRARAVFDGIGGDVLSAGLFLDADRQKLCDAGRFRALAELLVPRASEHTLRLALRREVRALAPRRRAVARVAAELERHADAANPIGSFYFWNRTRREISLVPFALLSPVGTVFAPYLDHDLYDFLAALPVGLLLDHQLHTDAIRLGYPRFRDVPFEDKALPGPDPWTMQRDFLHRLRAYARRDEASASLTRAAARLVEGASFAHRFLDVFPYVNPQRVLYLLQLERMATGEVDAE